MAAFIGFIKDYWGVIVGISGFFFDLYAYTDEKIIFRESLLLILTVLVGYILLVMILQLLRRRSVQEMEQQKKEQERKYQTQLEEQNRKLELAVRRFSSPDFMRILTTSVCR